MISKNRGLGFQVLDVALLALVFLKLTFTLFPYSSGGSSSAAGHAGPLILIVFLIPYLPSIGISLVPSIVLVWLFRKDFQVRRITRYTIGLFFVIFYGYPIATRLFQ